MLSWDWFTLALHQMHDEVMNRAYQAYCTTAPGYPCRAARDCTVIPRNVLLEKLCAIDVPTVFVRGSEDAVDDKSLPEARGIAAENDHLHFREDIPHTGHQMHIENPQETAQIIKDLFRSLHC